jgi:hypothetical protein
MRKDLNSEVEQLRKEMRQGGAKNSGINKNKNANTDEEKKEENVPSAEFVKLQELIKEHERKLGSIEMRNIDGINQLENFNSRVS